VDCTSVLEVLEYTRGLSFVSLKIDGPIYISFEAEIEVIQSYGEETYHGPPCTLLSYCQMYDILSYE